MHKESKEDLVKTQKYAYANNKVGKTRQMRKILLAGRTVATC